MNIKQTTGGCRARTGFYFRGRGAVFPRLPSFIRLRFYFSRYFSVRLRRHSLTTPPFLPLTFFAGNRVKGSTESRRTTPEAEKATWCMNVRDPVNFRRFQNHLRHLCISVYTNATNVWHAGFSISMVFRSYRRPHARSAFRIRSNLESVRW